ncbi:hypothetical protein K439DRAFT_825792 [Ramaria rubella]|nr:hypothetical protein K439DRAFT_75415 [Ramaria rubella]KAF8587435.1 hypothetical protein K439DRAFT_825792 [Ramaria rubella]
MTLTFLAQHHEVSMRFSTSMSFQVSPLSAIEGLSGFIASRWKPGLILLPSSRVVPAVILRVHGSCFRAFL